MDAMLSLEPVVGDNLVELRKLCDEIEVHIRNLQQFGVQTDNYGPVLISIIRSKIPNDVNLEISRHMPDGPWSLQELFAALKREVVARERCMSAPQLNQGNELRTSSSTLFSAAKGGGRKRGRRGGGRRNKRENRSCAFCDGNHQAKSCRTVTSVEARGDIILWKKLCYI